MRTRLLVLALVLILAIPLALLLRDFVRDVLLVEVWRVFWGVRILFESLPQLLVWALLLVALLVLAVHTLRPRRQILPDETRQRAASSGRVQVLSHWIDRTSQGEYFKHSLAQHLGGLAWEVMAQREHTVPERLRQRLRMGELDLPPAVEAYLQSGQAPGAPVSFGFLSRLRLRLSGSDPATRIDPALPAVIRFLEDQLEISPHPRAEPWGTVGHEGQTAPSQGLDQRQPSIEG